jgi:hypothetical protein
MEQQLAETRGALADDISTLAANSSELSCQLKVLQAELILISTLQ